jgi:membrane-associated protease RseP (regulator of RpoE activity)
MRDKYCKVAAIAIVLLALAASYVLVTASAVSVVIRAVLEVLMLAAAGIGIQRALSFNGGFGLYLLSSKKGLRYIDGISKHNQVFWRSMAMWGFVLGFGVLSYPLMRGKLSKKLFAFGLLSLAAMYVFVTPYLGYSLQFINLSAIQGSVSTATSTHASLLSYVVAAITLLFGFSGFAIVSIFYSAATILYGIGRYVAGVISGSASAASALSGQVPGVVPIIPGLDIPFAAGIISLVILLTVHELSHGVLSRIFGAKLKSLGLLMFGILPIGAFVEPEDKTIKKLAPEKQTGIFSAGIAANFVAMLVFFALMFATMLYIAPRAYSYGVVVSGTTPGYPAYNVLSIGSQVLQWNGQSVSNIGTLEIAASSDRPGKPVAVVTSAGAYTFNAIPNPSDASKGIIGVSMVYEPIIRGAKASLVYFLYTLFALSMLLNFLVAVFNLLPIPGLDGWSIYNANIRNKRLIRYITAIVLVAIAINALPWLFYV